MISLSLKSYAKVNLFLDITGKRKDGYHNLSTIFQMVSLYDIIKLKLIDEEVIRIKTNNKNIPEDENNLAYKAAMLFFKTTGIKKGLEIEIKKNIPTGAGLGGGSSNASVTLLGLNKMFNYPIDFKKIKKLSEKIGSDCPFFLVGGTIYATGKGNILKESFKTPKFTILIFYPNFEVKTEFAYKNFLIDKDLNNLTKKNINVSCIINALRNNRETEIGKLLYNIFEDGYFKIYKDVFQFYSFLKNGRCLGVGLAGSGSSLYAIYKKKEDCISDFEYLKNFGNVWMCRTISSSEYLKTFKLLEDELCRLLK